MYRGVYISFLSASSYSFMAIHHVQRLTKSGQNLNGKPQEKTINSSFCIGILESGRLDRYAVGNIYQ
mgnify:CR=1 FL=1